MSTDPKPVMNVPIIKRAGETEIVTQPGTAGTSNNNLPASDPENAIGPEEERLKTGLAPAVPAGPVKQDEADVVIKRAQEILKEYEGLESNIPLDNEYWALMNRYRGLQRK